MQLKCECGQFEAELSDFPKNTPGRLKCYCDDCQTYLHHLKRDDLLDANGGTEIIPAYPADLRVTKGHEKLKCIRLSPRGMLRFSTTCCNTPVGNTRSNSPWVGIFSGLHANSPEKTLGAVRASIMGRFAKGTPPPGTPSGFNLKGMMTVLPFIAKGKLLKKSAPSPFFNPDGATPVVPAVILTMQERQTARTLAKV